jgi:hypothetical protein
LFGVTLVRKVFSLLTTMAMASVPDAEFNRFARRAEAAQFSTSLSLMAREALETSVSPVAQNRSKPPPGPTLARLTLPAKPSFLKLSAITSASG